MADTLEKYDLLMTSLGGAAMDMGSQWYSDTKYREVFSKFQTGKSVATTVSETRTGPVNTKTGAARSVNVNTTTYADEVIDLRKDIINTNKGLTPAAKRYASGKHGIRNTIHKIAGSSNQGLFKNAGARLLEIQEETSLRAAGVAGAASGTVLGRTLTEAQRNTLKTAGQFRKLSIGLTGVWAAGIGVSLGKTLVGAARDRGTEELGKRWSLNKESFSDSDMAYTTRQRALRAIQSSQSGFKRALGQEANFIHTYR